MQKADPRSSLILFASAVLAYCATPWFGFVFDDRKQVLSNPAILHLGSVPGFFVHAAGYLSGDSSYYRPLFGAWLSLNYFLFGLHPAGWHVALLALHAAVVFLCYRVVQAVLHDETAALLAALLFAVHPVHVESIAWVSGGTDPLAAVFVLSAFLLHLSGDARWQNALLGSLAFFASLLCKETALLFPLLILGYELLLGRSPERRTATVIWRSGPYFVAAGVYLALRIHALGAFSHTLTPLPTKALVLTFPSVAAFYLRLLFFPAGLSPFYDTPYVQAASFANFVLPLLLLLGFFALLAWWIHGLAKAEPGEENRRGAAGFFVLWTILFLVPAFNLAALDMGEIAHDRYLYLPSIGFCALAAMALRQLTEKIRVSQAVRAVAVGAVALALGSSTFAQSLYWKDDRSLYERGASIAPENINAQNNLANIYLETGDFTHGIAAHQKILKMRPEFVRSYFNLGLAYYNLGDFARAQAYLQHAIQLSPTAESYFYLGLAELKKGDAAAAEQSLATATRMAATDPRFHAALAIAYEVEGKLEAASGEMERAVALDPQNENLGRALAKLKARQGQMP